MKKFKDIYTVSVALVSLAVMIFFIEHQRLVYAASGFLWFGLILQIAVKGKSPEQVITIRSGRIMKLAFGVMGLSNAFLMLRGINQIMEYGVATNLHTGSFIATPLMLISFFTVSDVYIYEEGIVADRSIFEFSKLESMKWEKEDDPAKLSFEYEGRQFSMDIPSKKVDQVNEVLIREGFLVDGEVLEQE